MVQFLLFSNALLLLLAPFAMAQSVRPTFGGALHGDESTLEQQVEFVLAALPPVLSAWNLELIGESVVIDSERDHRGEFLRRYYYEGPNNNVEFYPFISRTVHFLARSGDGSGAQQVGSVYFVEHMLKEGKRVPKFNQTARTGVEEVRKKRKLIFALAESPEEIDFANEISEAALHLRSPNLPAVPLSSSVTKLNYVKDQLEVLLEAYGYRIIPQSLNIDYYGDYGRLCHFRDRFGQMVTAIAENGKLERRTVHLTLWENHIGHGRKLKAADCNSTLISTNAALNISQSVQLLLSHGPYNEDLRNELDPSVILERSRGDLK